MLMRMSETKSMSVDAGVWPRPHRLTVDEYYRMAEAGVLSPDDRVELIEGEIVDMAPIGSGHAAVVRLLTKKLVVAAGARAEVSVQSPLRLGAESEPHPDIALLMPRADSYSARHPTSDDVLLIIEVSESTLHFDLDVKAELYARHRIPEYWVVDLIDDTLHVHRAPRGRAYTYRQASNSAHVRFDPLELEIEMQNILLRG